MFCLNTPLAMGSKLSNLDFGKMAERGGFEPPVRFNPYNGLANRRFRPLSHLSVHGQIGTNKTKPFGDRALIVKTADGCKEMQRIASGGVPP